MIICNDLKPYEKIMLYGPEVLSSDELLSIILRTGTRQKDVCTLSREIIDLCGSFRGLSYIAPVELKNMKGIGKVKYAQLRALIEINKRFSQEQFHVHRSVISSSHDVVKFMRSYVSGMRTESFWSVLLDSSHAVIACIKNTTGTVSQAYPIIREICASAIERYAASLICVHNHPSLCSEPSEEDKRFTRRLQKAGELLNINVLDHIIITEFDHYSFADSDLLSHI